MPQQIKDLDDAQLLDSAKQSVSEEKRLTQIVLDHLEEISRRRLYAERGYASLFEFCVSELGYDGARAQRRINAMRVIAAVPEAREKLREGKVNLSTLSQLQTFIVREEKIKDRRLDHFAKLELLSLIENKSQKECEREFVTLSPLTVSFKESQRVISDEFTEVKFIASKALMQKLKELQKLLSHKDVQKMAALIETLADRALKEAKAKINARPRRSVLTQGHKKARVQTLLRENKAVNSAAEVKLIPEVNGAEPKSRQPTSAAKVKSAKPKRYIPREIKRQVWQRDNGECQYVDPQTKRKCASRHFIQIDHIRPFAKKGTSSDPANLRLLCATHNIQHARHEFSASQIEPFLLFP